MLFRKEWLFWKVRNRELGQFYHFRTIRACGRWSRESQPARRCQSRYSPRTDIHNRTDCNICQGPIYWTIGPIFVTDCMRASAHAWSKDRQKISVDSNRHGCGEERTRVWDGSGCMLEPEFGVKHSRVPSPCTCAYTVRLIYFRRCNISTSLCRERTIM